MFLYAQRLKLALADSARRLAFQVAAGVVLTIGAGFLLAALWSWLATGLGWGSALSSLVIGVGLVLIALILLVVTTRRHHRMPTTDELKQEIEAQVSLAADAAAARARAEALRMADLAGSKVHSLLDQATSRASKFAGDTERRVHDLARDTAQKAGLSDQNIDAMREAASRTARKASAAANSNAGSMAKLLAAFAIGVTLASRFSDRRRQEDPTDSDPDDRDPLT